jgi:hypothetical protein
MCWCGRDIDQLPTSSQRAFNNDLKA